MVSCFVSVDCWMMIIVIVFINFYCLLSKFLCFNMMIKLLKIYIKIKLNYMVVDKL